MGTINDQAAKKRNQLEKLLIDKYEGRHISISGIGGAQDPEKWGLLRTIGVDWLGADEFQVIMNLDSCRVVMDYEDFLKNVEVIDGLA